MLIVPEPTHHLNGLGSTIFCGGGFLLNCSAMSRSEANSIRERALPELVSAVLVVAVSFVAALFAHEFRALIFETISLRGDTTKAPLAAHLAHPVVLFITVTGSLLLAAKMGRLANKIGSDRLGLKATAAAARGEGTGPSVRGTLVRSSGTFVASAGLASLGRESAILESGGALGFAIGAQVKRRWSRLAQSVPAAVSAAGIAAAFAAAYHAPFAAIIYVEEHLGVRDRRRSLVYTLAGAALGHYLAVGLLDGHPVFPIPVVNKLDVLRMGAIAVIPAAIGSTIFLRLREQAVALVAPSRTHSARFAIGFAIAGGVIAVVARDVAGNGMEVIRQSATGASVGLMVALALAKLAATTVAVGATAPGGVFSPTMAVAAGWALLAFTGLRNMGVELPGAIWPGIVAALAVGIAIGLESPLVAIIAIPEMTGDLSLVPVVAVVVGAAVLLRAGTTYVFTRRFTSKTDPLHDEDA